MSNRIKLTREQILHDKYLDDIDVGDSSEEEIDDLEINEESDTDNEDVLDEDLDQHFKVPETISSPPASIPFRLSRSETVEMVNESEVGSEIFGRAKKNPFRWNSKQNKQLDQFIARPEIEPSLLPKARTAKSIIDFFNLIFSDELIEKIVFCTNLRISQMSRPVTTNEIRSFIGLLILFGVTNKSNVETADIWSPGSVHYLQ
jgi:hypothetical protein